MMKIVTISDTHWRHNEIVVPKCDILLHAGDISGRGRKEEVIDFLEWYSSQPATHKVFIAGNHDFLFENNQEWCVEECEKRGIIYLNDSYIIIRDINTGEDIKIWGSPVQPAFYNWAFNRARTVKSSQDNTDRQDYGKKPIEDHWKLIPKDIDILITHGPPYNKLDQCNHGEKVGCKLLADKILEIKPKLHLFGHIHEARGIYVDKKNKITYVNTSSLDINYKPWKDRAFVFDYNKLKAGLSVGRDYDE